MKFLYFLKKSRIDELNPQTSIFDNQKIETIVIGGIESNKNITCSNGELIVVNNKLEINLDKLVNLILMMEQLLSN